MRASRLCYPGNLARSFGVWAIVVSLAVAATAWAQDGKAKAKAKAKKARAEPAAAATADESPPPSSSTGSKRVRPDYIDAMLQEAWANGSVKASAVAPDAEYMRRAYLDILGRIPTAKEAAGFLDSKEQGKRAKLIEYLLASPDYARNFATQWTILLIGRKNQGREVDRGALTAWLRTQFASNRPWNEMAYELIAAKGSNKTNGAANFVMSHLEDNAVPLTSIMTRSFLCQQIQCTQCHDHPNINEWKQADFWGINAFLKGVRRRELFKTDAAGAEVNDGFELYDEPTDAFATYERRNAMVGIAFPVYLDGRRISQGKDVDRREELAKFITGKDNHQFARAFVNRMWAHFTGRGFAHPTDDFRPDNTPSLPELLDKLAADFEANNYNVKDLIRWVTASKTYHLTSATTPTNEKDETLFSHMFMKPMTPEQLFESLLVATNAQKAGGGDSDKRRDEWLKQFLFAFSNDEGGEQSSFQGTIPQALMMMNGELMEKATNGSPGSYLADVLTQARYKNPQRVDVFVINRLYLSALSRYPAPREMSKAREFLHSSDDPIPVMEDIFWALLNSNEFILNR